MQYVTTIDVIRHVVTRHVSGQEHVRANRRLTHIAVNDREMADALSDAINRAHIDNGVNVVRAETGIQVHAMKGTIVLPIDIVLEMVDEFQAEAGLTAKQAR